MTTSIIICGHYSLQPYGAVDGGGKKPTTACKWICSKLFFRIKIPKMYFTMLQLTKQIPKWIWLKPGQFPSNSCFSLSPSCLLTLFPSYNALIPFQLFLFAAWSCRISTLRQLWTHSSLEVAGSFSSAVLGQLWLPRWKADLVCSVSLYTLQMLSLHPLAPFQTVAKQFKNFTTKILHWP